MAGTETLTDNERVRAVSTWFFNLSAALTAAAATRVWSMARFDLASLAWTLAAAGLFAIAYGWLYSLRSEDEP